MASPRTVFRASPSASAAILGLLLWPLPLLATGGAPRALQSGDLNGDGEFNLTDPITVLIWLFASGPPPVPMDCGMNIPSGRNGDADGNTRIDVTDAVYLLGSLFLGGPQPVPIPCSPPLIHKSEIINMTLFLVDERGRSVNSLTPPDTLIYDSATGVPIPATDGHPMTLAEFLEVRGSVSVGCTSLGTHAVLELTGLVPNGLYTIWVVTFKAPGFHEAGFDALIGNGALGDPEGNSNGFRADGNGRGSVSALSLPGSLSVKGTLAKCWPEEEFEVHLVGAYHLDGKTYGAKPGAPGDYVMQFAFEFVK